MPSLRPPPPDDALRCANFNAHARCRNPRIRGQPFCRSHVHLHHPDSNAKKKGRNSASSSPAKKKTRRKRKQRRGNTTSPANVIPTPEQPVQDSPANQPEIPMPNTPGVSKPIFEMLRQLRAAKDPKPGQIWALPHQSDFLPRSYARIDRLHPDKLTVDVTPLEFHPVSYHEFYYSEKQVPISCGTFRLQNYRVLKETSELCHQIGWEDDVRDPMFKSFYKIYPQKGQIWAVYRELIDGEERSAFKLVEVVDGFSEGKGFVSVADLEGVDVSEEGEVMVKLACSVSRRFSMVELVYFSHRVPLLEQDILSE